MRELRAQVKRSALERVGFTEVARIIEGSDIERARTELRPAIEAVLNAGAATQITAAERLTLVEDVLNDVVGLGPLQPLLDDEAVSEIMVNGCKSLFVERSGTLRELEVPFENDEQIRIVIDRIISPLGRRVDERRPTVNARLPSGYRVNAVIPPVALNGPTLDNPKVLRSHDCWSSWCSSARCPRGMRGCSRAPLSCGRIWRWRVGLALARPHC